MPATPSKATKPRAKASRKGTAGARKTTASKAAGGTTTARKAARRKTPVAKAPVTRTTARRNNGAGVIGDYAERAVLIPVGAALLARDRVVSSVTETVSTYSSTTKTQAQLRRFERRGVTARNRLEREVRKARVRVERQLRTRRRIVERSVNEIDDRREAFAKNGTDLAGRVPEIAKEVQERILSLV